MQKKFLQANMVNTEDDYLQFNIKSFKILKQIV